MGLAAAGSAVFQMSCAAQALDQGPKLWNLSASLNGFYDNNYNTGPSTVKKGSFGFEVSPTFSLNVPLTQTEIGALYTYDLLYYQEREHLGENPIDQAHTFNFWVDHSFNAIWQAKVSNSFVSGQDPALVNGGLPYRIEGNNINNNASVEVDTEWSRLFSTVLTYGNNFVDYQNSAYSAALNRDGDSIDLKGEWTVSPVLTALVGYQFDIVGFTGNGVVGTYLPKNITYYSDSRDNLSHIGYVGVQYSLLQDVTLGANVGIQYNDAYNNPLGDQTVLSPYANVSVIYNYAAGCNAQLNFTQSRTATDFVGVGGNGSLTQDQESSVLSASINQRVTAKVTLTGIASVNLGTFHEGNYSGETDTTYATGLSANYAFTQNISGNINYNYDNLTSEIAGRGYQENRISIGISVAY